VEYRRYKDLAMRLESLAVDRGRRFGRPRQGIADEPQESLELEVDVWELVKAYARLVEKTTLRGSLTILYRDIPIEIFIEKILQLLSSKPHARFSEVIGSSADRANVIGSFLAVLELMKQQYVRVHQPETGADFLIERRTVETG
jgi:segregation and condensation protein A